MGVVKSKDSRDFYAITLLANLKELNLEMPINFVQEALGHISSNATIIYQKYKGLPCESIKPILREFLFETYEKIAVAM